MAFLFSPQFFAYARPYLTFPPLFAIRVVPESDVGSFDLAPGAFHHVGFNRPPDIYSYTRNNGSFFGR